MRKRSLNIGLVSAFAMEAGVTPLSNIVDILSSISNSLYIITGNKGSIITERSCNKKVHIYLIWHKAWGNILLRVARFIYAQLRASYRLLKLSKNVDLWIFFGGWSLLPMLVAKLLRQVVIFASTGSSARSSRASHDTFVKVVTFLEKGNYIFSDRIILYSGNLIQEENLARYRSKISIAHEHFLDFNNFKIQKQLDVRDNIVGYIARLSEEKGILNFARSIPAVLDRINNARFLIGGEGQMYSKVEEYLNRETLNSKVNLTGWIPHNELPRYLNDLKLLVLASYTEGLPNIMLEAMACGTPVLATAVGAMPDIIRDGETGFIMEDNSPECIAQNIIRALSHPNLEEITRNARALVEKEYTYEAAVESYRKVLYSTLS